MAPTPVSENDHEKHKGLDREVREMVSTLSSRLKGSIMKKHRHHEEAGVDEDDEGGSCVITVAGTNTGATMRAELNGNDKGKSSYKLVEDEESSSSSSKRTRDTDINNEALSSYINTNFQAINNSIMFGGSYTGNDPGVHMDISDLHHSPHHS